MVDLILKSFLRARQAPRKGDKSTIGSCGSYEKLNLLVQIVEDFRVE